ncbi:hypothetical protein [Acinetobacter sp. GSS19]|uniref:hypothetical protein n=1 Tax=Acinetobacter sp. GSS19 TaxID=3020716 RepID=UPI0023620815|nr:hypothetical protein [Acinetobacter sp. GSS19]
MATAHFIKFDPADNPMQLSKIGNWVMTYLSPEDELVNIRLAFTTILPQHISEHLQPLRICIAKAEADNHWQIENIECYDSQQGKDVHFHADDAMGQLVLDKLFHEFDHYDIPLTLIRSST